MSGGEMFPLLIPRAWRQQRRRADAAFGRQAVVEDLGAVVQRALSKNLFRLLKPYSPSLGLGSQRRGFWTPALPNTGARR